jgi:hypothetical protein
MLLRLSLIIALIAALAVGIINFVMVADKVKTVEAHRAKEQADKETAQQSLAKTEATLKKTEGELTQTKETLKTTTEELGKSQQEVAALNKKVGTLTDNLAKVTEARDAAQSELAAYKATGQTPEKILNFAKHIKELEDSIEVATEEKTILTRKLAKTTYELRKLTESDVPPPELPATLRGKVVASDPKWSFVVLDVGEDQGVVADGEMLVNRNGKLVAKVKVRTVEKGRCIANIMPGWKLGEVVEGDQVLPAS